MDGQMDVWVKDGQLDGWIVGCLDRWMGRWKYR